MQTLSTWRLSHGGITLVGSLMLLIGLGMADWAAALCVTPQEEGVWYNIDPNTSAITQAEVSLENCGDVILCDTDGHCTGGKTTYSMTLWGQCHPSDCYWGKISGEARLQDGAWWIVGTYEFGWKTATVWLRTYEFSGITYLRVWVWNDYHDTRTDRAFDGWFLP